jgi:hypothetical protein
MRSTLALLAAVMLTGCVYNYPYSHNGGPVPSGISSMYTVINNSGYTLAVYQDGKPIGTLRLGQVLPIKTGFLWSSTVITVTGTLPDGSYVGSASWIFEAGVAEAWSVTRLNRPNR